MGAQQRARPSSDKKPQIFPEIGFIQSKIFQALKHALFLSADILMCWPPIKSVHVVKLRALMSFPLIYASNQEKHNKARLAFSRSMEFYEVKQRHTSITLSLWGLSACQRCQVRPVTQVNK